MTRFQFPVHSQGYLLAAKVHQFHTHESGTQHPTRTKMAANMPCAPKQLNVFLVHQDSCKHLSRTSSAGNSTLYARVAETVLFTYVRNTPLHSKMFEIDVCAPNFLKYTYGLRNVRNTPLRSQMSKIQFSIPKRRKCTSAPQSVRKDFCIPKCSK